MILKTKERELLERWLDDTIFEPEELDSLMEETKELLAQPEPKREPLSDEEISKLWGESYSGTTQMVRNFARAIEKAHGIGGGK